MDYDVFISCKSEDYKYAENIYQFLVDNGFNVFLASRELRNLGDSEYRRAISSAMKSAYHMILFASNPAYIDSTWVYYEWDMFLNAKLKGFKPGQIVTILKDMKVEDINMDLWKYESFTIDNYQEKLLPYMETPSYIQRVKEEKRRKSEAEHLAKIEAEQKQIAARREAKSLVITLAEEYKKKLLEIQSIDFPKLVDAMKKAEITERVCPVCGAKMELAQTLCPDCCWNMSPLEGIEEFEYLVSDQSERIEKAKARIKQISAQSKKPKLERSVQSLKIEPTSTGTSLMAGTLKRSRDLPSKLCTDSDAPETQVASKQSGKHITIEQFDNLLLRCIGKPPYSGVFDHTKLNDVEFHFDLCRTMADDLCGVEIDTKELRACCSVLGLKKLLKSYNIY